MWQGPFGIMRTIACFKHPTPASVLVPFLSPCLPPCSLQLVPLLLFLSLSLAVLLCACISWTHRSPCFPSAYVLVSLCSLQVLSLVSYQIIDILLPGCSCISIAVLVTKFFGAKPIKPIIHYATLSLYHMLPYLPSYLVSLSSPLPCFFPGLRH